MPRTKTPQMKPEEILATAKRLGHAGSRGRSSAVYDALEPAVRHLVQTKGYQVKGALAALEAKGCWQGTDKERESLYRSMCYRIAGKAGKLKLNSGKQP